MAKFAYLNKRKARRVSPPGWLNVDPQSPLHQVFVDLVLPVHAELLSLFQGEEPDLHAWRSDWLEPGNEDTVSVFLPMDPEVHRCGFLSGKVQMDPPNRFGCDHGLKGGGLVSPSVEFKSALCLVAEIR